MSTFKTKPTHKFHSILMSCGFISFKNYCAAKCFFPHFSVTTAHKARSRLLSSLNLPPPKKKVVVVVISLSLVAKKKHTCVEQSRERAVCPLATSHHPLCLCCYSLPQIQLLTTKRGTGGRRREEVRIYILLRLLAHRLYQVKVYLISKEEEEEKDKMVVFID